MGSMGRMITCTNRRCERKDADAKRGIFRITIKIGLMIVIFVGVLYARFKLSGIPLRTLKGRCRSYDIFRKSVSD